MAISFVPIHDRVFMGCLQFMGVTPKKSQVFLGIFIGNSNENTMNFFMVISVVFHCIHNSSVAPNSQNSTNVEPSMETDKASDPELD